MVLDEVAQIRARISGDPGPVPEVLPRLLELLHRERDPAVLGPVIEAIGVARCEQGSLELLPWTQHPDPTIRLEAVQSIPGGTESFETSATVADALTRSTRDASDEVRDWATFGLGTILDIDTSAVRATLFACATDPDGNVRDEALVGLARRRDRRALALVQERLAGDRVSQKVWEAAELLATPALLDVLYEWFADNPDSEPITNAIRACDPVQQATRLDQHATLLAAVERLIGERGLTQRVAICCERFDTDVLLETDTPRSLVWFVDAILENADYDVDRAARIVVSRIEADGAADG